MRGPKVYIGSRSGADAFVVVARGTQVRALAPRPDLLTSVRPSARFEWGYEGDGPTLLAVSILADAAGDEFARAYVAEFDAWYVRKMDASGFELAAREVYAWVMERLAVSASLATDTPVVGECWRRLARQEARRRVARCLALCSPAAVAAVVFGVAYVLGCRR